MTTTRTLPMLAQSIDVTELPAYVKDNNYVAQLKADGHRLIVQVDEGIITVLNRRGMPKTSGVSHALLAQFEGFGPGRWLFDGELIGAQFVLFDAIALGDTLTPASTFTERYDVLRVLYERVWQPDPKIVILLPVAVTADEKLALIAQAEKEQREGIMLRHVNGVYWPGGRSPHLKKCKFTRDIDAIITAVGIDGKDNVEVSLIDPDNDRIVPIGRVTSIGKFTLENGKRVPPALLDVWEVRFLGTYNPTAPRLYQPRLMRKRTDKVMSECLIDQLDNTFIDRDLTEKTRADM